MIQQYRRISNGVQHESGEWRRQAGVLRELLFSFHNNPGVARYVRSIEAAVWLSEFADLTALLGSNLPSRQYSEDQMNLFRELIPSDILSATEQENWYDTLRLGDEDVTLALVRLHTPNLESLVIRGLVRISARLLKLARVAAQGGHLGTILTSLRFLHLQNYRRIECLHFLRSFMLIPSLTSVQIDGLESRFQLFPDEINQKSNPLPQGCSNVDTIRLHGEYIGANASFELLHSARKLEHFEYCFHLWKDRDAFNGQTIIDGLLVGSQHILRTLHVRFSCGVRKKGSGFIRAEDLPQTRSMDLSGFTTLESIGLSAEMLFAPDEKDVILVQDQLPASIRCLSIEYGYEEPVCYV